MAEDDVMDDEQDYEDEQPSGAEAESSFVPRGPTTGVQSASAGLSPQDALKNYFQNKMGATNNYVNAMGDAQKTAEQDKFYARLGGAFNTIGAGIAGAGGGAQVQPNNQPFQELAQDANTPVHDLQQKYALASSNDKSLRDYFLKNMGIDAANYRADQKNALYDRRTQAMGSRTAGKQSQDQAKADSELGQKISTFQGRGINKNYAEAVRRGTNLTKLFDQAPNGDLNQLSQTQAALAIHEIDGLINSGAPTVAGSSAMMPSTMVSQWQQLMSKTGGKPTPAMLGGFLSQLKPYANDIVDSSRKYLYRGQQKLINSYQKRLHPDDFSRNMSELDQDYGTPGSLNASVLPAYSDPDKEARYQKWKASQAAGSKSASN